MDSSAASAIAAEIEKYFPSLLEQLSITELEDLLSSKIVTSLGETNTVALLEWLLETMGTSSVVSFVEDLIATSGDNRGPTLIRTVWTLLAISTIVLTARLLVKLKTTQRLYYDDGCMLAALLFGYLHAIFTTIAYHAGLGQHMTTLSLAELLKVFHYGFISLAWGILSPLFGRLGFCIFLLFVAETDPLIKKWPIYAFMIGQCVVNVGSLLVSLSQCGSHLDVLWSSTAFTKYTTYCWLPEVQTYYGYFAGAFNTTTDIFLTCLPALMIVHTSMSPRQKIGLALLLCMSILAMAASIVKTYEAKALSEVLDYPYDLAPYVAWISVELNVVMTVASVPLLRPLLKGASNRLRGTLAKHGSVQEKFESISLGSIISKNKQSRSRVANLGISSSEEHIAPHIGPFGGIIQTVEVEISSTPSANRAFVHAALVGLVHDDTSNASVWH